MVQMHLISAFIDSLNPGLSVAPRFSVAANQIYDDKIAVGLRYCSSPGIYYCQLVNQFSPFGNAPVRWQIVRLLLNGPNVWPEDWCRLEKLHLIVRYKRIHLISRLSFPVRDTDIT